MSKCRLVFEPFRGDLAAEQHVLPHGKITWSRKTAQLCGEREFLFWKNLPVLGKLIQNRQKTSIHISKFVPFFI